MDESVPFPQSIQGLDEAILKSTATAPSWATAIFYVFTMLGGGFGLLVLLPFLWRKSTRIKAGWLLVCVLLTSGLVSLLKLVFERGRPCDVLGWCSAVRIPSPGGYSFPSGHAAGAFAFATYVAIVQPRLRWFALFCAFCIAWSRCMLLVHYPSDVLGGALFGAFWGAVFALGPQAKAKARTESQSHESSPSPLGDSERPDSANSENPR